MAVVEFPGRDSTQVEIMQAIVNAAETLQDAEDDSGMFIVYLHPNGSAELIEAANVSASEVIAACFMIATEQTMLMQCDE